MQNSRTNLSKIEQNVTFCDCGMGNQGVGTTLHRRVIEV